MKAAVPVSEPVLAPGWRWERRWRTLSRVALRDRAGQRRRPARTLARRRPLVPRTPARQSSASNAANRSLARRSSAPNAVNLRASLPSVTISGLEWVVDARGCDAALIADLPTLRTLFTQIIEDLGLTPVADAVWHVFPAPGGITGLFALAESHLTVHTFPE